MLRCRLALRLLFVGCVFAPSAPGPLKTNDLALAIAADIRGRDWPELIRDYEAYARKHKESDTNIMYLEKVQLDISKATSTQDRPLDSFQLGWKWHASYEKCHQAYKDLKQHLHAALSARTVPGLNMDYIGHLIDLGACLDARPRDQVELSIFEAIVDVLFQLRNQEEGKIDSTVRTLSALFSSRYNNLSTQHSAKYYLVAARIKLLLAKQEEAVKLLIAGIQKYPDSYALHEQLLPLVLDPQNYILQDVMQVEEAGLKKSAPPAFTCLWEQVRSAADWSDALSHLKEYAVRCGLEGPTEAGVTQAMRGFLQTGLLEFQKASETLKGPDGSLQPHSPGSPAVIDLLRAVANYRHRLLQALGREADRVSNKDLATIKDRLNAFLRRTTEISQGKQVSQSHRDRRARERAEMETKAAEYVKQQEQLRKVDAPLSGHLGALEQQVERQTEQAEEAARECLKLAAQDQWWEAREKFEFADYNLKYFVHVQMLQQNLDEQSLGQYSRPNRPGLDLSALGMGAWRNEYGGSMLSRRRKREELVAKCRDTPKTADELQRELEQLAGRDVRPECERMKEVASIQAEALLWPAALSTLHSSCQLLEQDDYAIIVGSFSAGLLSSELPRDGDAIRKAIDFILEDLGRAGPPTSIPQQAAILSFVNNLRRKLDNKIPVIKPYEKVKYLFPNLRSATWEAIVQAMDRHAADHTQFLPIIHEAFRLHSSAGARAYYMHEACLCNYYKRSKDFWQAYLHLLEAFKSRDGRDDPLIRLELDYARRDWYRDVEQIFKRSVLTKLKARLATASHPKPRVEEEKPKAVPLVKAPVEKGSRTVGSTAASHSAEKRPVVPTITTGRSPHPTIAPSAPSRRAGQVDQKQRDARGAHVFGSSPRSAEQSSFHASPKPAKPQSPSLLARILGPRVDSKAASMRDESSSPKAAAPKLAGSVSLGASTAMGRPKPLVRLESPLPEAPFVPAIPYTKLFAGLAMDEVIATINHHHPPLAEGNGD